MPIAPKPNCYSTDELGLLARQLYTEGPYLMRKLMHYRVFICPFDRLIPHVPLGSSILDVGCGAGLFLALLASCVPELKGVGFDSSAIAIETAGQMARQLRKTTCRADLSFTTADVRDPWQKGTFDVVSLVDVIHHVPSALQRKVVSMAADMVKPGGFLLYKDMANRPAFHAGMNRLHDLLLARQWIHYVPVRCVDDWAGEHSLTLTHSETISRLWYRHELRVYRKSPGEPENQSAERCRAM